MKKLALFATLALIIGLVATQAFAYRGGPGYGCPGYGGGPGVTAEQSAEYQKFFEATQDLRNKMFADRAEMQALMRSENPDPAKVRALAESIAQTRDQMADKAAELGITAGRGYGGGCAGGGCGGYGRGQGRW